MGRPLGRRQAGGVSVGPFVIDTTVLIDATRKRAEAAAWLVDAIDAKAILHVSTVAVAEYMSGVRPQQERDALDLLGAFEVLDVTLAIGRLAGNLRFRLARQGRALALGDALIAATALGLGLPLVTSNLRDFRWIDRLDLVEPVVESTDRGADG